MTKVFAAIEQQTGFVFFYDKLDIKDAGPVTVKLQGVPLKTALEMILATQPVEFEIQGNTIVITKKKGIPTIVGVNTNNGVAPPEEVHGHVTDSVGNPLPGASVKVKGTNNGTQTDEDGNFSLKGVPNNATLVISYLGYETQMVKLTGGKDIRVQLRGSTVELDQTVVKGYYSTTQRLNTGDVTTVKGADIEKQPVSDPMLALDGRVPGLYIQQASGVPGAYSTIRIRGQNSIANGNNPLYIVDGVPYNSVSPTNTFFGGGVLGTPVSSGLTNAGASPFNDLNPADIENIEVLKDADATAIYGSRGANGVILITTKKGKAGSTRFILNGFSGAGKVTRFMHFMNTQEYLNMRHEALVNDGKTKGVSDHDINGDWDTTRYTNWQKVLIGNTANFNNINASLSGGNNNTRFKLSGGYSNQGTVYPGAYSDQKAMASFNLTHSSIDQKLHAQLSANYVFDNSNLPQVDLTSYVTLAPDAPALFKPDGSLNWQIVNGASSWNNPFAFTLQKASAKTNNLVSNLSLSYLILPGLQLKGSFGYSRIESNQTNQIPASAYSPPYNNLPAARSNNFATTNFNTWIVEPQLNYERDISKGRLNLLIGSTFQQSVQNAIGYTTSGYASDALISDPLAAATKNLQGFSNTLYHYDAVFGRLSYDWQGKYLINATARRDGSSRFGPGKQFGNFGAVGIGWVFSREQFIQNALPFLSFGKLRASYGSTGNDQITDYQYLSTYTPNSQTYQGVTGISPTSLPNPYFAWELVKKLEGGIELGILNDRILLSANYYRDRTGNQLVGYPLPLLTGFSKVQANLRAVVQNSGGEFSLSSINIKSKSFTWTSSINLTIPQNRLISYPNLATSSYAYAYVIGKSLFIAEKYHVAGVNDTTGTFQYVTSQGLGTNPAYPQDLKITKPITQHWYGGLENSIGYKGFKLDFLIQFVEQTGINYLYGSNYFAGAVNHNYPTAVLNHWQKSGDIAHYGRYSTISAADPNFDLGGSSDFGIGNNSFLRLKNLAISYELTKEWLRKLRLQDAKLFIQCQNLFTITHNYLGFDPDKGGWADYLFLG